MFRNRASWMVVAIVIAIAVLISYYRNTVYENSSAGFSISYPARWEVDEIPESNIISFGRSRVTVEVALAHEFLGNEDVIRYVESIVSVNLENGQFVEIIENPHIIRVGEYQAARARVKWIPEFSVYFGAEVHVLYGQEADQQMNVITDGNRIAFVVVNNPNTETERMVRSFSFTP
jgi:hypothetical protein